MIAGIALGAAIGASAALLVALGRRVETYLKRRRRYM